MTEQRFRAGDTVVLNGHRLTVEGYQDVPTGYVWLAPNPLFGAGLVCIPEHLIPEPQDTFHDGSDLFAAHGVARTWLAAETFRFNGVEHASRGVCAACAGGGEQGTPAGHGDTEGVTESSGPATTPAPSGQTASSMQPMSDPYALNRVSSATPAPPDDHRDAWDTFGTKRGVVMAEPLVPSPEQETRRVEAATAALTPGMAVAHRDGRFGVYVSGGVAGRAVWRSFGDNNASGVSATDLRPVTLVGRPEREAFAALLCPALQGSGDARRRNSARIYDALFGESS